MKRIFPGVFEGLPVRPVDDYPSRLLEMLESLAPPADARPARGAAHARHLQLGLFRAQLPGAADGRRNWWKAATWWWTSGGVFMRTTKGLERVDVIYRRIDDDFLDPRGLPPGFAAGRARV